MVEFGTSSTFRGWVRVRVLGYGFGVRGILPSTMRAWPVARCLVPPGSTCLGARKAKRRERRAERGAQQVARSIFDASLMLP